MAPSAVKTTAIRAAPVSMSKINESFNKEFFIGLEESYGYQDEIKGTVKQPPASFPHYLPVWDNETGRCVILQSCTSLRRICIGFCLNFYWSLKGNVIATFTDTLH